MIRSRALETSRRFCSNFETFRICYTLIANLYASARAVRARSTRLVRFRASFLRQATRVKFSAVRQRVRSKAPSCPGTPGYSDRPRMGSEWVHSRAVNDSRACHNDRSFVNLLSTPRENFPRAHRELMENRNRMGIGCFHAAAPGSKKETSGAVPPCKSRWRTGRQPGAAQTSSSS